MKGYTWAFFFFQAEDGIRDLYVTGVQTCALPISGLAGRESPWLRAWGFRTARCCATRSRSEERRVGKECRSLLLRQIYKKKCEHLLKQKNSTFCNMHKQLDILTIHSITCYGITYR